MKKIPILIFVLLLVGVGIGKGQYTVLHNFNDTNGAFPMGDVTYCEGKLYGMTVVGGAHNQGCIFSIDTTGNNFKDIFNFYDTTGVNPHGSLIVSLGKLYGMAYEGGTTVFNGCIFSIDTSGREYKNLYSFTGGTNGYNPTGNLTLSGGLLFGMIQFGGATGTGFIFSIDTNGTGYKDLFDLSGPVGCHPYGSLIIKGSRMYGMTSYGGTSMYDGTVFSMDTDGSGFTDLLNFNGANGEDPAGSLILLGDALYGMTYENVFSIDTNGNGFKDLLDFNGTNGYVATGSLTLSGNELYGMTVKGGMHDSGVIFSIYKNGSQYKDLFDFTYPKGYYPNGSLIHVGNKFYGMASLGGMLIDTNNQTYGVIFSFKDTTKDTLNTVSINSMPPPTSSINVYPNPSNGVFTLSSSLLALHSSVEVYNVLGEQVKSEELRAKNCEIDISNQPNGVYLYLVVAEDGGVIGEGKLVVNH